MRVNAILGPDATASTVDDDDPNDQSFVKAQNSTTASVIRSEADPILFGAWGDRSWQDVTGQGESSDFTVGFSADDIDVNDMTLVWAFHDIARQADGDPEDLPVPTGGGPAYWLAEQSTPKAAVIPPQSAVEGIYLVGEDHEAGEGQRLWIAHSPDGATSWSTITALWNASDPNDPDIREPYLTVWMDPNDAEVHMMLTWTEVPHGSVGGNSLVMYSISDDSGDTFSSPARLSDPIIFPDTPGDAGYSASAFGRGPGGADFVYVVWFQHEGISGLEEVINPAIKWRRYAVGSQTWTPSTGGNGNVVAEITPVGGWIPISQEAAPLNFALHDQASVVVDHSPGRIGSVYVAFSQLVVKTDPLTRVDPDIFVATLRADHDDFEPPVQVNDDPLIPVGQLEDHYMPTIQFMPWVAVTDLGHVGVGWYDRRDHTDDDITDGYDMNRLQHYYFAYSIDGGRHFSDNEIVTEVQSDPVPAIFEETDMGTYTSIAGVHASIFPLWIDLRDWDPDQNLPGRLGDVYSGEVRICEGNAPDADNDCDVDTADFGLFGQCYSGLGNPASVPCLTWDFDFDGDVDGSDFAVYNQAFTGHDPCDWGCEEEELVGGPDLDTLLENEDLQALYEQLEAYCEEHEIPFT